MNMHAPPTNRGLSSPATSSFQITEGWRLQHLFIIDVTRGYLPAALLTAAAYAMDGEALLVQGAADQAVVGQAVDRFRPARVLSMPGCTPKLSLGGGGEDSLPVEPLPSDRAQLLAWMIDQAVDGARGVVMFPAGSPSWAIKGAALAVRLGYLAWPLEEAAGFAYAAPAGVPVLVLGEAPGAVADTLQGREFRHLPGDRALAAFLQEQSIPQDYVVLVNSADLEPPAYTGPAMGTVWTQGLSLLAPLLASYRSALVIDARTPRADSREIERTLNQKVQDAGLRPDYLAILAAPGAIPFIHEPQMSFGGGEDSTRDIHLRLNDDIYFDCAEGRLFGQTAGKVSLQLLSTKHHAQLQGGHRTNALIFNRPHVEGGVTFAIDEATGRTQLKPLFKAAGLDVTELYDKDCQPEKIAHHLRTAGLAMYGGHGSTEALSTHQAPLYAEFLPTRMPPGVVYACACSTMYPKPNKYSSDGGFSFEEEATPFPEQIGPAFVDRGALAFVGGLTVEDVLLNTAMYVVFAQALVLKGLSVGQAVRAARNHSLTHLGLLSQSAPGTYSDYRNGLANTIQQQIVLGDPAFTPYAGTSAARLPISATAGDAAVEVSVTLPEAVYQREMVAVDKGPENKEFHRAKFVESWVPVGEDVVIWGENYTVARDSSDQSHKGVMGAYLHLTADLPVGRVPVRLTLEEAEAAPQECLLCGHTHPVEDATARFRSYVVPFQGSNAPVKHDQSNGWAYTVEETPAGLRVHWFLPTLAVEESTRQATVLRGAKFCLEHVAGVKAEGRLEVGRGQGGVGAPGAMEGTRGLLPSDLLLSFGRPLPEEGEAAPGKKPKLAVVAQTLSGPGGRWSCWLPAGEELQARVDIPMPVYRHAAEAVLSFKPDVTEPFKAGAGAVSLALKPVELGVLKGVVVDAFTGRPLPGAKVRIWRGKQGPKAPITEGYVGEAKTDAQGRFEFGVPAGSYLVQTAHRTDLRYFSGKGSATVFKDREAHVLVSMEPGAVLTGQVTFKGAYTPRHAGIRLMEHGNADGKSIGGGRTRRDGRFEILVSTAKPFDIKIHPEGFKRLVDENGGEGYHLAPGEVLERSYTVEGEE